MKRVRVAALNFVIAHLFGYVFGVGRELPENPTPFPDPRIAALFILHRKEVNFRELMGCIRRWYAMLVTM